MATDEAKALSGIAQLIKEGREHPEIIEVTRQVILQSGVRFGDDVGELDAIYQFVDGRVRYIRDPYQRDIYQSAIDTLNKFKTGDCEDQTILMGSMALTVGYPLSIKLASVDGKIWDHIYPLAGLPPESPTRWVAMDATLENGRLGIEPESKYQKMFRFVNGMQAGAGEPYIPPADWQQKILDWLPLVILAPIAIYLVTESIPGGR